MPKRLYFGHPVNTYTTELESRLLQRIARAFPDWEIENPNQKYHQEGYARWTKRTGNGMDYFAKKVLPSCQSGIFLPFRDGKLGAGVYKEAKFFADQKYPIWLIDPDGAIASLDLSAIHSLTVEETRSRIRTDSGDTVPY